MYHHPLIVESYCSLDLVEGCALANVREPVVEAEHHRVHLSFRYRVVRADVRYKRNVPAFVARNPRQIACVRIRVTAPYKIAECHLEPVTLRPATMTDVFI